MNDGGSGDRQGLQKISESVNASRSAVSKALNNRGGVSAELKRKVVQTSYGMNYIPRKKRRIAGSSGSSVGVVMPGIPHYFWQDAVCGMKSQERREENFRLKFSFYSDSKDEADVIYCLDYLLDSRVDLLVVTPPDSPLVIQRLKEIGENIPIVFFNETIDLMPLFYAGTDFEQDGIRLARASKSRIETHPGILSVTGAPLYAVGRRDEAFRREIGSLLPDVRWAGEINTEEMPDHLIPAQLARMITETYKGSFRSVYVSQGVIPQVCMALQKLKLEKEVVVFGYENPKRNARFAKLNMIAAVIEQDTYEQGARCIEAVYRWFQEGMIPDKRCIYVPSRLLLPQENGAAET